MFLPTPACLGRTNLHPKPVDTLVVVAAGILHNSLLALSEELQELQLLDEAEELGGCVPAVRNLGGNRATREACGVRKCFNTFFTPPQGSVSRIAKWYEGTSS